MTEKALVSVDDSTSLETGLQRFLDESEQFINLRVRRNAQYTLEIGERLLEVHERLAGIGRDGLFQPWLQKIRWSQPTAWRYMQLATFPDENKPFIVNTFFPFRLIVLL